jgi:hypothetical protein
MTKELSDLNFEPVKNNITFLYKDGTEKVVNCGDKHCPPAFANMASIMPLFMLASLASDLVDKNAMLEYRIKSLELRLGFIYDPAKPLYPNDY